MAVEHFQNVCRCGIEEKIGFELYVSSSSPSSFCSSSEDSLFFFLCFSWGESSHRLYYYFIFVPPIGVELKTSFAHDNSCSTLIQNG